MSNKFQFPLIDKSAHQISFHSDDPDVILYELILDQNQVPYRKHSYALIRAYTVFRFSEEHIKTADRLYKKLRANQGKSFLKSNNSLYILIMAILFATIVITCIFQLVFIK